MAASNQPLVTAFPSGDARLPIEPQVFANIDVTEPKFLPNVAVSCLTSADIGGFGRTAQATCLLEQVLRAFDSADINSKLLQLDRINTMTREFLALVMLQCSNTAGIFCSAVNVAMRSVISLTHP